MLLRTSKHSTSEREDRTTLRQSNPPLSPAGSHAPCTIGGASSRPGIVLVSSGSTLLSDFQNWRADMATMQGLAAHANRTCVAAPEKAGAENQQPQPHMRSRGLLGSALGSLADPTEAASVAGDVMQMFSTGQSVTSVTGTVQDPALMNEVARQLRALNVQVLIPEPYNPLCPRRYRLRPLSLHAEPAKHLRRV